MEPQVIKKEEKMSLYIKKLIILIAFFTFHDAYESHAQIKCLSLNRSDSVILVKDFDSCFIGGDVKFIKFLLDDILVIPERIKRSNNNIFVFFYEIRIDTNGNVSDVFIYKSEDNLWTTEFAERLKRTNGMWRKLAINGRLMNYAVNRSMRIE